MHYQNEKSHFHIGRRQKDKNGFKILSAGDGRQQVKGGCSRERCGKSASCLPLHLNNTIHIKKIIFILV